MMRKNQSLSKQISYMTLAMLIFGMLALSVFALALFLADSVDFNAERALAIADSVAAAIDPEEFVNIMADREKTDYWYGVKAFADSVKIRTGVKYLYVLENGSGDRMTYFMEGYNKDTDTEDELDLGAQEDSGIYDAKMFEALSAGTRTKSGIYPSGDFGYMVSGFSPILDETGRILGVVGVDLQIGEVLTDSLVFGIQMVAGILLFSLICVLVTRRLVNRRLAVPVGALTEASRKIALGDMDISIPAFTGNEIGRLADSFREMADSTKKQVLILEALAEGDLTVKAVPRSSRDVMGNAMAKTISNLSETFRVMQDGIAGVSSGAAGIAKGTEVLAQGSAKQSAAIERLSASVSEVAGRTKDNARLAGTAAELAGQIKTGAEKGAGQMNLMVQAVKEINEASQAIGNVINTIDDIARQTNLLALNASVEAARAGQHGKGFAVVADEVRNLAAKSAEAAKGTAALIDRTVEKTALGVRIAGDTAATFAEIVDGINESSRIVTGIAASSGEQSASITDINSGIEQVSIVVQQNTAVSAESADAAGHMSSQAINLQAFAGRFKLPPS